MTTIQQMLEARFGPAHAVQPVPADRLAAYAGVLPAELLAHWQAVGWCAYGQGLLWCTDPLQFADLLDEWVDFDASKCAVFMRSSFAHLYVWHDGHAYSVDVQRGSVSRVTKDILRMVELVCDPEVGQKILRLPLHQKALDALGVLQAGGCYAFEPALALGGSADTSAIRLVKMREQLGLLAQLIER